ncbi:MAG: UvrD-helicase domain-containing protein, partial [Sinobacteraceae bacterium]|nr:UvrD-helicase domain-containing protein [Nevskiaceae bacterium]
MSSLSDNVRTRRIAVVAQPITPADDEARERATDPALSVLLQAPAGSGKTTVLTERLLRLLAVVDRPEEILAITFTRKAAAEMRARVLQALRGESSARTAQEQRLRRLAAAALAHAEERGWKLQQDPGRLRIQTIDAFNFRLACQLTISARAGGTLQVTERAAELYRRAAGEALAEADRDPQLAADVGLLFERLDNRWQRVQQLLADMLQRRGHWLRYVLSGDPDSLCARVSESLRNIAADHLEAAFKAVPAVLRAQAARLPGMGALSARADDLGRWQQLSKLLLTKTGEWRKPGGISKSLGVGFETREGKEALRALLAQFEGMPAARQALVEIYNLPGYQLCGADAGALRALARMLRAAAGHLQLEFAASRRVDHTFVAGAARAALSEESLPTDFALRTGQSLRHILVDEFQDTSLAQFDLLQALTAGWEAGDGRTLFIVGDPMQSIYQFREAEVGLFLRARAHGIGARALEPLQLCRNFRSVRALIEWNNRLFARLFPAEDNLRESAVAFTSSMAGGAAAETGSVPPAQADLFTASPPAAPPPASILLFDDARPGAEMDAIVGRIVELRRSDAAATIAVLVAARTHAAPIIAALEQQDVDTVGVELVALQELSIIRDLVALARALLHPGDRTAWLAVLRAPWCGASLHSL